MSVPHCLDYWSFVVKFWDHEVLSLQTVFFYYQGWFLSAVAQDFHTHLGLACQFLQKPAGILIVWNL